MHDTRAHQLQFLAVRDYRQAHHRAVLEGSSHEGSVGDGASVVREGHGAGAGQLRHLGQRLAGSALCDGRYRVDHNLRLVVSDELDPRGRVDCGLGVGHCRHRRHTPVRGRARPALDGLLVLPSRFTQVHVHVHEAWRDDGAGRFDHPGLVVRGEPGCSLRHDAVHDQKVQAFVGPGVRVHQAAAPDQQFSHSSTSRSSSSSALSAALTREIR